MYNNKRIIAFIPARSGSKRLKGKNFINLNGKPLFQYSIEVAKESKYIDDIIVSSDSEKILKLAHELGCLENRLRPTELSTDHSRIIESMIYELKKLENNNYDSIILLQPTFPLRNVQMLDEAIEKYYSCNDSLITVVNQKETPLFIRKIVNGKLCKIINESSDIRSQDLPKYYRITGCIYINKIADLTLNTILNENNIPYEIDEFFNVDIDNEEDLKIAEERIKNENLHVPLCVEE